MHPPRFLLKPFPGDGNPAGLTIGGSIRRRADTLSLRCEVRGNLSKVLIPAAAEAPRRRDRLWEETCVELFLGAEDSGEYRELNLSPSGHWNVYRFSRYREGMLEETAITSLPFDVRIGQDVIEFSMELDAGKILHAGETIEAGVAAVISTIDGRRCHWALAHFGPRPDFHRREGFALVLPGKG